MNSFISIFATLLVALSSARPLDIAGVNLPGVNIGQKDVPLKALDAISNLQDLSQGVDFLKQNLLATAQSVGSEECARYAIDATKMMLNDTTYENRPVDIITRDYLASYGYREKRRGILNKYPVTAFPILADQHLVLRFGEYAAMSYCETPDAIQTMAKVNGRVAAFQLLKYGNDTKGNVLYYVAANTQQNLTVVVLRGSVTPEDYIIDILGEPQQPDINIVSPSFSQSNGTFQVHTGFWKRFKDQRDNISRDLKDAIAMFPSHSVVVVGHSLGAAWAYLEAADLVTNHNVPLTAVYVYGMPKTGNQAFVDAIAETVSPNKIIRFVNGNDLIPHGGMGPNGIQPSLVTEYFAMVGGNDVNACQGAYDTKCSTGIPCNQWSWSNHSAIGQWSMRKEWCKIGQTNFITPDSIYQ